MLSNSGLVFMVRLILSEAYHDFNLVCVPFSLISIPSSSSHPHFESKETPQQNSDPQCVTWFSL